MQYAAIAAIAMKVIATVSGGEEAAKVANRNASLMREGADADRIATYDKEGLVRERSSQLLAGQRASLAQNGVDSSGGTAAIGVAQNTIDAEMDALTLRYEGLMGARTKDIQADLTQWEGKAKRRQSYWSAGQQIMSAIGSYGAAGGAGGGAASSGATAGNGLSISGTGFWSKSQ